MFAELTAGDLAQNEIPEPWRPWATAHPDGTVTLRGDRLLDTEIFAMAAADRVLVATSPAEIAEAAIGLGWRPALNAGAISHLLHHAFVPLPQTVYDGIWLLGMGDELTLDPATGEGSLHHDYPWLNHRSAEDEVADDRRLLDLLTASVERNIAEAGGPGFLMLSSGKDSVGIAVALAEAGRQDVTTATYRSGPDDEEAGVAAALSKRLGLDHTIVEIPKAGAALQRILIDFFSASPLPCADLAIIPTVACLDRIGRPGGFVLDGSGNDGYMGYPSSSRERLKQRLRIRGRQTRRLLTRLVPVDSPLTYLLRSRIEATFTLRTLRYRETERFFPHGVDTHAYWHEESRKTGALDLVDLIQAANERHTDQAAIMLKTRLGAAWRGATARFPYCDATLADYCFGLPEADRFDRVAGKNKLLLRQMLANTIGYDADALGKRWFSFDGAGFLIENDRFVRDEIIGCELWSSDIESIVSKWLDALPRRPNLYASLLILFQVSAWYNHSQFAQQALHPETPDRVTSP